MVAQYTQQMLAKVAQVYRKPLTDPITEFYDIMLTKVSSAQRLEFVAEIIDEMNNEPCDPFPTIRWSYGKSDEQSLGFRSVGNQCFQRMEYVEALKWYNKALAQAESNENLGVCFANRSAAYYELSMFQICLENIETARKYVLSDSIVAKLHLRRIKAQDKLLTTVVKPHQTHKMKLCRPANRSQPFSIDCLSKPYDYVITSQQLQAGEVISLEKPYSQILSQSHIYERCTYCLTNKKHLSMIPCPHCSSAMFCNAWCYGMAMKIFHKFECSIIDGLFNFLTDYMYLGLRTVLTGLHDCNGSMDEYQNMLMECFDNVSDPLDVNVTSSDSNSNRMVFLMIHNLPRSFNFSMQHHVAAALVAEKLRSNFKWIFDRDATTASVLSTSIFHLLQVSQENSVLLEETVFSSNGIGNDITFYGCGLFPFASSFKLSCAPNVLLLNDNGTMVGIAMRKIDRNEEIIPGTMSRNHFLTDRHRRNERMWRSSGQLCHCIACIDDSGLYTGIPSRTHHHLPLIPLIPETCSTLEETFNALKSVCHYLNSNHPLPFSKLGWSTQAMVHLLRQVVEAYGADLVFTKYLKSITNV